tara:strand:+ start:11603 stop:11986 length:384 start_codon:yes stop_codon:yes gene_type:complete
MKNKLCKYLILLVFYLNHTNIFSQDVKLNIKQDSKIDSLLKKKIELDRDQFKKTYFTLQLYYGDLTLAEEVLERSKETFPHIKVELSFETPNYKVQAGRFKDKLKGLKTLDTFKNVFPSAFLLSRRD